MISVHEQIQPTQEKTKKPNSEWDITSAMEPGADEHLKQSGKSQKSLVLPWSLKNDRQ